MRSPSNPQGMEAGRSAFISPMYPTMWKPAVPSTWRRFVVGPAYTWWIGSCPCFPTSCPLTSAPFGRRSIGLRCPFSSQWAQRDRCGIIGSNEPGSGVGIGWITRRSRLY